MPDNVFKINQTEKKCKNKIYVKRKLFMHFLDLFSIEFITEMHKNEVFLILK